MNHLYQNNTEKVTYRIRDLKNIINEYLQFYLLMQLPEINRDVNLYVNRLGLSALSSIKHELEKLKIIENNHRAICELSTMLIEKGVKSELCEDKYITFHQNPEVFNELFDLGHIQPLCQAVLIHMKATKNTIEHDVNRRGRIFHSHSNYRHNISPSILLMFFVLSLNMMWSLGYFSGESRGLFKSQSLTSAMILLGLASCIYLDNISEKQQFKQDFAIITQLVDSMESELKNLKRKFFIKAKPHIHLNNALVTMQIRVNQSELTLFKPSQNRAEAKKALTSARRNLRAPAS